MKTGKKNKFLSISFIFIGLLIMIYPKASDLYKMYQQQKLIKIWQQSFNIIEKNSSSDHDTDYDNYREEAGFNKAVELRNQSAENKGIGNNMENANDSLKGITEDNNGANTGGLSEKLQEDIGIEGIIKIEKIDLELPILTDATEKNMKVSVASIKGTGNPGQIGNYAIAGHRSHTYGKNFNRLDEVEVGDSIIINNGKKQFNYEVMEKLYVKPEEVEVLEGNVTDKEITLVTCHPMINPTHRLIIKGKIKD
ncbi:sortase [Anaerocolumna sp.]|uniref:sortase n=1 Tax=Anaerocolumna sp. TaxID=2041569 RepID=UPI0028B0D06D|nr:sortase [Anaerocolumna sp.]